MTDIPDELIEKAALDLDMSRRETKRVILALGLPALLERVEAAEANVVTLNKHLSTAHAAEDRVIAERTALAEKVANAGERIAQAIEALIEVHRYTGSARANGYRDRALRDAAEVARAALTKEDKA